MRVALFAIEEAAHAELARQRAIDRFVQQQVARRVGAEGAVGLDLDRQLVVDALDIGRVGIDLTLVFQGDVLLGVFFAAHRKAQVAPAGGDLLATGFDRQRDADNRPPGVLLLDHHDRLAVITGLGRLGAAAQLNHGHPSGHRFVQQAGDIAVSRLSIESQAQQQHGREKTWHWLIQ